MREEYMVRNISDFFFHFPPGTRNEGGGEDFSVWVGFPIRRRMKRAVLRSEQMGWSGAYYNGVYIHTAFFFAAKIINFAAMFVNQADSKTRKKKKESCKCETWKSFGSKVTWMYSTPDNKVKVTLCPRSDAVREGWLTPAHPTRIQRHTTFLNENLVLCAKVINFTGLDQNNASATHAATVCPRGMPSLT